MPSHRPRHAARPGSPSRERADVGAPATGPGEPPRHATRLRPTRARRAVALALTGALAFGVAFSGASGAGLLSNLRVTDVDALLAGRDDRPEIPVNPDDPFAEQALNILVMGTDYRGAGNEVFTGDGNEFASDTTMLVHVPGDRSRIEVVSIPRDSLVEIPACPLADGRESRPRRSAMFNSAFTIGGGPERDLTAAAACTILTVEHNTGLRVTDHIVVKMNGMVGVVDALGGVLIDLPEAVRGDHHVNLDLPAGRQRLDGDQSINFLRARGGQGMGLELRSDLARIERQQVFVDAMMTEILSRNLVTDSLQVFRMTEAVLSSISTGRRMANPMAAAGLAWSMRSLRPSHVVFTPLPITAAPSNPNRVVWQQPEADALWARILAGEPPDGLEAYDDYDDEAYDAAATAGQ